MHFLLCFVFLAVTVTAQTLTDEEKATWNKWSQTCRDETGVTQEAINRIRSNQFDVVDDKLLAHCLCFSKQSGLVDQDGNILVDQVKAKLRRYVDTEEELNKIVNKCAVKKDTPEQTAFNTLKCLREHRPKFVPV